MFTFLLRALLLSLVLLVSIAGGCDRADRVVVEPRPERNLARAPAADWFETVTSAGTYRIVFDPPPGDLPVNEPFDMVVRVLPSAGDDAGAAGEDVALRVDAAMPHHRHGMNRRPHLSRQPDGSYLVEGMLLHMPGRWELYFDVTHRGVTERATIVAEVE